MKKLLLIMTVTLSLHSFGQQLPNSSFENWTISTEFSTLELDGWYSLNMITTDYPTRGTMQTTDKYDGIYALKLTSGNISVPSYSLYDTTAIAAVGIITPTGPSDGYPFTARPISYSFYFKYTPGPSITGVVDTALVFVKFTNGGNNVGHAQWRYWGAAVNNYTNVVVPIEWNDLITPDTVYANFASSMTGFVKSWSGAHHYGNVLGNELIIDKFEFLYTPTEVSEVENMNMISVYPNPASDIVTLNVNIANNADLILNIYNIMGTLVKSEILIQNQRQINTENLCNGIYMVEIKSKEWTGKQKLIIQK
jgi:hypothetical protein